MTLSLVAIPESVAINGSDDSNGRLSVHSDLSNNIILLDLLANSSRESWRNNYYITRCGWFPDNSVHVQVQNRSQDSLHLLRIDPSRPGTVFIDIKGALGMVRWTHLYSVDVKMLLQH